MNKEYDVYLCRNRLTEEQKKKLNEPVTYVWRPTQKPVFAGWVVNGEKHGQ